MDGEGEDLDETDQELGFNFKYYHCVGTELWYQYAIRLFMLHCNKAL